MGNSDENMPWLPLITLALRELGGEARILQIQRRILSMNKKRLPYNWKANVRSMICRYSTDSPAYVPGNPDVFYKSSRGVWGLRHPNDRLYGTGETSLLVTVVTELTNSEVRRLAGDQAGLENLLRTKIAAKKRLFRMT